MDRFDTIIYSIIYSPYLPQPVKNSSTADFAREHYKNCKYPKANIFRKLFPEEAEKVR